MSENKFLSYADFKKTHPGALALGNVIEVAYHYTKDKTVTYYLKNKEQLDLYNKMKYSQQDRYYSAVTGVVLLSGYTGILLVSYGFSYYFVGNTEYINKVFIFPVLLWFAILLYFVYYGIKLSYDSDRYEKLVNDTIEQKTTINL